MNNTLKISACIIVYNHESYLRDCIEGALKQKVSFDYEIVIGEDHSTDNSLSICKEYAQKYPNLIRLIERKKNLGMIGNWVDTILNCNGKYIAMCEGDDYWTDPLKLQTQVDFMENNSEFSMCFHPVHIMSESGISSHLFNKPYKSTLNTLDLLKQHYIPTCSLLFAKQALPKEVPKWFYHAICADIPLEIILSVKGIAKYIDTSMACYRRHLNGISQSSIQVANMKVGYIKIYQNLIKEVNTLPSRLYLIYLILRLKLSLLK